MGKIESESDACENTLILLEKVCDRIVQIAKKEDLDSDLKPVMDNTLDSIQRVASYFIRDLRKDWESLPKEQHNAINKYLEISHIPQKLETALELPLWKKTIIWIFESMKKNIPNENDSWKKVLCGLIGLLELLNELYEKTKDKEKS